MTRRKKWAFPYLWVVSLFVCVTSTGRAAESLNGNVVKGGDVAIGAQLSEAERCQECHGKDGISDDARFPSHAGQHAGYLIKQLQAFRSGERQHHIMNRMAEDLSDRDMADIAAYFAGLPRMRGQSLRSDPAIARLFAMGDGARGLKACAECHGEAGQGKVEPDKVYPRLGGQRRVYLRGQLAAWKLGIRRNSPDDVMNEAAKRLTDDEIEALADYLEGL